MYVCMYDIYYFMVSSLEVVFFKIQNQYITNISSLFYFSYFQNSKSITNIPSTLLFFAKAYIIYMHGCLIINVPFLRKGV